MVARMKLGMFDPPGMVPYTRIPHSVVDAANHRQLALEAARKSMVLLKNENNTLPASYPPSVVNTPSAAKGFVLLIFTWTMS